MSHPYRGAPSFARWSKAVSSPSANDVDPIVDFPFRINIDDCIVTAGSCFAQHIARYLSEAGFNHFVAERAHPLMHRTDAEKHNYGVFSARYGNIYTSRQLVQLFKRALGLFEPREEYWEAESGYIDPYRPTIQPGNFHSLEELRTDRDYHLTCVRRAMKKLDFFVFTLGLTEGWISTPDGAAFPVCPGVSGGDFDPSRHAFLNLTVEDVVSDMREAIGLLRGINPAARIILTVSPVPLAATAERQHVLEATTLSKSRLRVAADMLAHCLSDVVYFPSYEIITGNYTRGIYFAKDLRSVTDAGVAHVMRLFFKHAAGLQLKEKGAAPPANVSVDDDMDAVTQVLCEEALLDSATDS